MDLLKPSYYIDVKYNNEALGGEYWSCVNTIHTEDEKVDEALERMLGTVQHFKSQGQEVRIRMRTEQVIFGAV